MQGRGKIDWTKYVATLQNAVMNRIAAAKFKQQCLAILDRVEPEGILITKHGKPVATLFPAKSDSAHMIGALKGKLKVKGDILSTGAKWDAES